MTRLNRQNKIVVGVIAFILALTVGYALFSETLNINGTATAQGDFDVIFSSVETLDNIIASGKAQGYTNQEGNVLATISEDKHTLELSVNKLDYPGAYIEIPVTIKNTGSIDAVLKGIQTNGLENDDIQVTYTGLVQDDVINANADPKDITIKVMWKAESTNSNPAVLNFDITLNYEQYTPELAGGETGNNNTCTTFDKKDTYNVGDVIALCNEQTGVSEDFYVIKDNGDTVTMLAKYNLLVGNVITYGDEVINAPIDTSEVGYGLQSNEALGYNRKGVISFADSAYWVDVDNVWTKPLSKYGTSYPAEVYDNNSKLYNHVENYKTYINNTLGKTSASARLLTYNEAVSLGCSEENYSCSGAPNWVMSVNYWTSFTFSAYHKNYVKNEGFSEDIPDYADYVGIRPVMEISKSDI